MVVAAPPLATPEPSNFHSETRFASMESRREVAKTLDLAKLALAIAPLMPAMINPDRMPIIAITTKSSIRVKDRPSFIS